MTAALLHVLAVTLGAAAGWLLGATTVLVIVHGGTRQSHPNPPPPAQPHLDAVDRELAKLIHESAL